MKTIYVFGCVWVVLAVAGGARGEFVPGHVFLADPAQDFCFKGGTEDWDRIWEVDPETGEVTLFAEFFGEECRFITGLAFTPDGCRLRASAGLADTILELDSEGQFTVALDASDGITAPWGSNNMTYDAGGNFYVVNAGSRTIMRFPADGGPGSVIADNADGIEGRGAIAVATDGDVYYGNTQLGNYVLRITPEGQAIVFDDYGTSSQPFSLTADDGGHVYVALWGVGMIRYRTGDPNSRELVASNPALKEFHAITMAPNQRNVYAATFIPPELVVVDPADGSIITLAEFTEDASPVHGIAVVPLPTW